MKKYKIQKFQITSLIGLLLCCGLLLISKYYEVPLIIRIIVLVVVLVLIAYTSYSTAKFIMNQNKDK